MIFSQSLLTVKLESQRRKVQFHHKKVGINLLMPNNVDQSRLKFSRTTLINIHQKGLCHIDFKNLKSFYIIGTLFLKQEVKR